MMLINIYIVKKRSYTHCILHDIKSMLTMCKYNYAFICYCLSAFMLNVLAILKQVNVIIT